jgi:hypothetical protein
MPEKLAELHRSGDVWPQNGMLATVRHRHTIISSAEPYDEPPDGRLHLVQTLVAYEAPILPADFDGTIRAARWSALAPFLDEVRERPDPNSSQSAAEFCGECRMHAAHLDGVNPYPQPKASKAAALCPDTDLFGNTLPTDVFGNVVYEFGKSER